MSKKASTSNATTSLSALELQARNAYGSGNVATAIKHFTTLIGMDGSNIKYFINRARCFIMADETSSALTDIESSLEINKDSLESWLTLAHLHVKLDNRDEVEKALNKALSIDPNNEVALNMMAVAKNEEQKGSSKRPRARQDPSQKGKRVKLSKTTDTPNTKTSAPSILKEGVTSITADGKDNDNTNSINNSVSKRVKRSNKTDAPSTKTSAIDILKENTTDTQIDCSTATTADSTTDTDNTSSINDSVTIVNNNSNNSDNDNNNNTINDINDNTNSNNDNVTIVNDNNTTIISDNINDNNNSTIDGTSTVDDNILTDHSNLTNVIFEGSDVALKAQGYIAEVPQVEQDLNQLTNDILEKDSSNVDDPIFNSLTIVIDDDNNGIDSSETIVNDNTDNINDIITIVNDKDTNTIDDNVTIVNDNITVVNNNVTVANDKDTNTIDDNMAIIIENNVTIVNNNVAIVNDKDIDTIDDIDDNMAIIEDNVTIVSDNVTIVNDNVTIVDDNVTIVNDNVTIVNDNVTIVNDKDINTIDDNTTTVHDNYTNSGTAPSNIESAETTIDSNENNMDDGDTSGNNSIAHDLSNDNNDNFGNVTNDAIDKTFNITNNINTDTDNKIDITDTLIDNDCNDDDYDAMSLFVMTEDHTSNDEFFDNNINNDNNVNENSTVTGQEPTYVPLPGTVYIFESNAQKILAIRKRIDENGQEIEECLMKFKERSYRLATWEPRSDVEMDVWAYPLLKKYIKEKSSKGLSVYAGENFQDSDVIKQDWLDVERIIGTKMEEVYDPELGYSVETETYHVKWKGLDYTENTWEFIEDMEGEERHLSILERAKEKIAAAAVIKGSSLSSAALSPIIPTNQSNQFQEMDAEMLAVSNIELRSYQVDGINWLMYQWATKQKGAILGDEMGLGKTIQSIAFIETLRSQRLIDKPVIIVAPVSTIENWQKEFEEHSDASVVVYNGTQENREKINLHEFIKISDSPKSYITNFDVLLTTYSFATTSILKHIGWSCIIIDEAHKLKSDKSVTKEKLIALPADFKLLLTGTPIQNTVPEIGSLLNFIDPEIDITAYGGKPDAEKIKELQSILKKFLLRRTKDDIGIKLPQKTETIIDIELTFDQKQYYRALLEKNRKFLAGTGSKQLNPKLNSVLSQILKCCNHCFLIKGGLEFVKENTTIDKDSNDPLVTDPLIFASGKFIFLHKLLPKLKREDSKSLIFSKFTTTLDIIQDYLVKYNYEFSRIDGSTTDREAKIKSFNDVNSTTSVFLLSTKAGGVGINLQAANTVIIFDGDFNPHNDLQAISRSHRIGQQQQVNVFRLLTKNTVEYQYFKNANKKLGLSDAILTNLHSEKITLETIAEMLRNGSISILEEDDETSMQKSRAFMNDDIDKILQSGYQRHDDTADSPVKQKQSIFSQVSFELDNENSNSDTKNLNIHDKDFWEKALQIRSVETKISKMIKLKNNFIGDNLEELKSNNKMLTEALDKVLEHINFINEERKSGNDTEEWEETVNLISAVLTADVLSNTEKEKYSKIMNSIYSPKRHRHQENSRPEYVSIPRNKVARTSSYNNNESNDYSTSSIPPRIGLNAADFNRQELSLTAFELYARSLFLNNEESKNATNNPTNDATTEFKRGFVNTAQETFNALGNDKRFMWHSYNIGINEVISTFTDQEVDFNLETVLHDFAKITGVPELNKSSTANVAPLIKSSSANVAPLIKSSSANAAPLIKSSSANAAPLIKSSSANAAPLNKSSSANAPPVNKSSSANVAPVNKSFSANAAPLIKSSSANVAPVNKSSSANAASTLSSPPAQQPADSIENPISEAVRVTIEKYTQHLAVQDDPVILNTQLSQMTKALSTYEEVRQEAEIDDSIKSNPEFHKNNDRIMCTKMLIKLYKERLALLPVS